MKKELSKHEFELIAESLNNMAKAFLKESELEQTQLETHEQKNKPTDEN